MKIDYVITSLNIGGAETQLVAVTRLLASMGHEIRVISLLKSSATLVKQIEAAGIEFKTVDMRKSPFGFMKGFLRLLRLLYVRQADVVHAHMVHANLICRIARLIMLVRRPLICTVHNTFEGGAFYDVCYRLTNFLSSWNATVSEAATDRLLRDNVSPAHRTSTIPNGVDTQRFRFVQKQSTQSYPFRWVAVGRLCAQKDYSTLIQAFAKLRQTASGLLATLEIYGQGPLSHQLHNEIESLGLGNQVFLGGISQDIEAVYRSADALVLSSIYEGYGLVIAEAMASGLPVVVTDSGGPAEVVGRNGECGLIVPPGDVAALSRAMGAIMRMQPSERQRMGLLGRLRIEERFSLDATCRQWLDLYAAVTGNDRWMRHTPSVKCPL